MSGGEILNYPYINKYLTLKELTDEVKNADVHIDQFEELPTSISFVGEIDRSKKFKKLYLDNAQGKFYIIHDDFYKSEKVNKITDYFSEEERIKAVFRDKISPYELYKNNYEEIKKLLNEEGIKKFNAENLYKSRDIVYKYVLSNNSNYTNNFRITIMLRILNTFKPKRWLDMCAGWGDRLLSAKLYGKCDYYGTDPNMNLKEIYNNINDSFVNEKNIVTKVQNVPFEKMDLNGIEFDFMFTSPPFFDVEIYSNFEGDSVKENNSYDLWYNNFLLFVVNKAAFYLKKNCYFLLYLAFDDKKQEAKFMNDMEVYLDFKGNIYFYDDIKKMKKIFVWKKTKKTPNPKDHKFIGGPSKYNELDYISNANDSIEEKREKSTKGNIIDTIKEVMDENRKSKVEVELVLKNSAFSADVFFEHLSNSRDFKSLDGGVSYTTYTNNNGIRYIVKDGKVMEEEKKLLFTDNISLFKLNMKSEKVLKVGKESDYNFSEHHQRDILRCSFSIKKYTGWRIDISIIENYEENKDELEIELIDTRSLHEIYNVTKYLLKELCNLKLIEMNRKEIIFKFIFGSDYRKQESVKSLNATHVLLPHIWREVLTSGKDIFITDKIDGSRKVLACDGFFIYVVNHINDIKFYPVGDDKDVRKFIIDTEEYEGSFYIFDVYKFHNKGVDRESFSEKVSLFEKVKSDINRVDIKEINVKTKEFVKLKLENYKESLTKFFKKGKRNYETDGYIIVHENISYKYKEHNTIDFYLKKIANSTENKYHLCTTIDAKSMKQLGLSDNLSFIDYSEQRKKPIVFLSSINPDPNNSTYTFDDEENYDRQVVEMMYNKHHGIWELIKFRSDRLVSKEYYGNVYRFAEINYLLTMFGNDLLDSQDFYFKGSNKDRSKNIRSFINSFKREIIKKYNGKNIIDFGAGRGQDLKKYGSYNDVEEKGSLHIVEKDKNAIIEFMDRRLGEENMNRLVTASNLSATADIKEFVSSLNFCGIEKETFDVAYCNLALHYFFESRESAYNSFKNIHYALKKDSYFVAIYLDGDEIDNMLSNTSYKEIFDINDVYALEKSYKKKGDYGTKIKVKLPFSGDDFYAENLLFESTLHSLSSDVGFKIEKSIFLDELIKLNGLTDNEIRYISLHKATVFKKL